MAIYENNCKECGRTIARLDVCLKSQEKTAYISEIFRQGRLPGMKLPKCGNVPFRMKRICKQ